MADIASLGNGPSPSGILCNALANFYSRLRIFTTVPFNRGPATVRRRGQR
jgi:hypothetical protein